LFEGPAGLVGPQTVSQHRNDVGVLFTRVSIVRLGTILTRQQIFIDPGLLAPGLQVVNFLSIAPAQLASPQVFVAVVGELPTTVREQASLLLVTAGAFLLALRIRHSL
jgi:hypothetical protein